MKERTINYYVIGGQYESYCYGGTETLLAAKRLATKNEEHWDNWQGWHKPHIYKASDCREIESKGRITSFDSQMIVVPDGDPCCVWSEGKWVEK